LRSLTSVGRWPGLRIRRARRQLTLVIQAIAPVHIRCGWKRTQGLGNNCCRAHCRLARPGQLPSSDRPKVHVATDRFQSTADVGRRPLDRAHSQKQSLTISRRWSALGAAVRPQLDQPTRRCLPKEPVAHLWSNVLATLASSRSPTSSKKLENEHSASGP
jgi:hypothetical protein